MKENVHPVSPRSVGEIKIADYNYPLPESRIAVHPLKERDRCRLLVCNADGLVYDRYFAELPGLLPSPALMVCNNTRVINARLRFRKETGAEIEVFLLEPQLPADYALMFQSRSECIWRCMVGNLKRWKQGALDMSVDAGGKKVTLSAERLGLSEGSSHSVRLRWDDPELTFAEIVDAAGRIPIPPYLNRDSEDSDSIDYQTIYSKIKGSVAAPTAGLHFTGNILDELDGNNITRREVTLHVGAGTFQPVKSEEIGGHPMHTEVFSVNRETLGDIIRSLKAGIPVAAVGTTSVRTIESLPYVGRHLSRGEEGFVQQWEAYDEPMADAVGYLQYLLDYMTARNTDVYTGSTAIMIAPGFIWNITDIMVTNFHQPESTLLLLVSSFLGKDPGGDERWRRIYTHALEGEYRFLSYGDACVFFRNRQ